MRLSPVEPDNETLSFLARFWVNRELCRMLAKYAKKIQYGEDTLSKYLKKGDTSYPLREVAKNWNELVPDAMKKEFFSQLQVTLTELHAVQINNDPLAKRLRTLARMFNLGASERDCLLLAFIMEDSGGAFRHAFGRFWPTGIRGRLRSAAVFTGRPITEINLAMAHDSALQRYGLVDRDLDICPHVHEFLCGLSQSPIQSNYFTSHEDKALPLDAYAFMEQEVQQVKRLILNRRAGVGVNLLFYGTPGTGKTELARSLGASLGYGVHEIKTMDNRDAKREENFRFAALHACQKLVDPAKSIIVIDEADEMLNAAGGFFSSPRHRDKAMVNVLMDRVPGVQIWITNASSCIDESIRRRYDYSIEFRPFTPLQRLAVWRSALERHEVLPFSADEMRELAHRFPVNAGGIDLAVRNFRNMLGEERESDSCVKNAAETMRAVLKSHMSLLNLRVGGGDAIASTDKYSLDGVNIRGERSIAEYVAVMRRFSDHLNKKTEADGGIRNMNLLLSGPPGTGKTEWTKFLSRELDRPLIAKRGSDLLSMYVGGTEQQLRQAFREAEAAQAILFLDEADSFLQARSRAVRSWEVTQVNELLTCMEDYRGILVCATNFKDNLDQAALRRFNLKIEFDYLNADGVVKFYGRFLVPMTPVDLTPAEVEALRRMDELTPGDFKVVWQKHAFLPAAEITHAMLLDALAEEVNGRRGNRLTRMGFIAE